MEMQKEFLEMIKEDIARIEDEVINGNDESRWNLFRELDGRYQVCIKDYYRGMWESSHSGDKLWFPQLKEKPAYVLDNLKLVKSKLETFRFQANAINLPQLPTTQVNVNNNINISITFEEVREKIEDMTSLTNEETEEVLAKISEIEEVVKSNDKKKTKWEKIKPVLVWLADKSCDVGTALLPLLLNI